MCYRCQDIEKFCLENKIVNKVIRDEVFEILEKYCSAIYYPLEDEDINGFHITRTSNGNIYHFVYINSANTIERQIFTAAHELGHICDVYSKVQALYPEIDNYVQRISSETPEEYVSNKFAAELLMPEEIFKSELKKELEALDYNGSSISKINLLRLVVSLMNTFFVDFKSTTKRFLEIGRISEETYNIIKSFEDEDDFEEKFKDLLKEGDFRRLNTRPNTKNMTNLTEYICEAEQKGCNIKNTIENLKNAFEIRTDNFSEPNAEVDF